MSKDLPNMTATCGIHLGWQLYQLDVPIVSTSWNSQGPSRPWTGIVFILKQLWPTKIY